MLLEIVIWLVVATLALSTGQAWAMSGGGRVVRYVAVWILSTAVIITIAAPIVGLGIGMLFSWITPIPLVLGALLTGVSLWIATG
jgi:hypothetical protein